MTQKFKQAPSYEEAEKINSLAKRALQSQKNTNTFFRKLAEQREKDRQSRGGIRQ